MPRTDAEHSIGHENKVSVHHPSSLPTNVKLDQDNLVRQPDSQDIIWPTTAGSVVYVGNDWTCFPLTQRLEHLQSLCPSPLPQKLPNATSTCGACTDADNFEGHMARLLKSARVALCIHNLAHQGIFPQVKLQVFPCKT